MLSLIPARQDLVVASGLQPSMLCTDLHAAHLLPTCGHVQAKQDIAASFQRVAVQHLADKTARAARWATAEHPSIRTLVIAGMGPLAELKRLCPGLPWPEFDAELLLCTL